MRIFKRILRVVVLLVLVVVVGYFAYTGCNV